jgi:hypothetical protein
MIIKNMEDQNKDQNGKYAGYGCWDSRGYSCWYHIVRWLIGIAIIIVVFSFGVMIGELKGMFESNLMYRMSGYSSVGYGRVYPMMQSWGSAPQAGTSAPVNPAP